MATAAERQRLSRRRKKLRKMVCRQVEVTEQEVELLRRRGYAASCIASFQTKRPTCTRRSKRLVYVDELMAVVVIEVPS